MIAIEAGRNLRRALDPIEDDTVAIIDFAEMLVVLASGPDVETVSAGIRRVAMEINDRAHAIHRCVEDVSKIASELVPPDTGELSNILAG
jgi:hypothetical protein